MVLSNVGLRQGLVFILSLAGTRFQPPLPVNASIGELLEIIESTQDPFLKFL